MQSAEWTADSDHHSPPSTLHPPPSTLHSPPSPPSTTMTTPMRRQYLAIKKQFPDTILFFRLGDFYETFDDDARIVSEVCDVVLTSRPVGADERVPLAGVPYHSVDPHIARLVAAGYKVAIAEQIGSEPPPGEKLVERTVRRVITAGTIVEPAMLEEGRNNYLAAIAFSTQRADRYGQSASGPEHSTLSIGLAYADITTGEFAATELAGPEALRLLQEELARLQPAEVLVAEGGGWRVESGGRRVEGGEWSGERGAGLEGDGWRDGAERLLAGMAVSRLPAWRFEEETARQALLEQFEVETLAAFGCDQLPQAVRAAGALVQYLRETQRATLPQLVSLRVYSTDEFMTLDQATRRNLELTQTIRGANKKGSLLGVLDATRTPMGSRLLRRWLHQPLLDMDKLDQATRRCPVLARRPAYPRRVARPSEADRRPGALDQPRGAGHCPATRHGWYPAGSGAVARHRTLAEPPEIVNCQLSIVN